MNDPYDTVDPSPDDPKYPVVDPVLLDHPQQIGRYRVQKILGKGGFGLVYLARDEQLERLVAIKVPHERLVAQASDAEAYLAEARTVAKLDHANIVPVHDVGSTEQFPCFVVSKYIDGTDLYTRLKHSRLSLGEAVELVATVAEALHHAHLQGLVHRDIKPGNILLDKGGKPFVADFGLALREQDVGKGPRFAGTPAYMSPEQARGEGHRVDGRSDVFSLGVVFYELLVGKRPFKADSVEELLTQITKVEARPPRQIDDRIPKGLERICLKTLAKRASERYTTAKDMADDLRHFLGAASAEEKSTISFKPIDAAVATTPVPGPTPASDQRPVKIVPKGLRSFDAGDADFFLELLPGPRDREGLPDNIRFWKARIETTDPDSTFSVGLIYGPSGCGKSSLVRAGLLPRLANQVTAVYIEATGEETESRLLKGLRRQIPDLPSNLGLIDSLAVLRQGRFLASGQKVVVVLDQFEQWLHAQRSEENTELVQALRQCDGGRVQCLVMVRDDFWMAATRFMRDLEVRLVEAQNSAAVDLFDMDHARKVLTAFGRAFNKLPENSGDTSKDQKQFLEQALSGLAQLGKVISVRLALFAEMMKGKAWTPATLKEVGGTEGVGVTFLEETFSASTAPPEHRYHQRAARAVLKALLPESGTDIKGHMRSYGELLEASGYASRPKEFNDLIRILDSEIRLITPTDPEGKEAEDLLAGRASDGSANPSLARPANEVTRYHQLTHDYLVPSLRDWLTRKQKETRRGRAELLLADRAAVWSARSENRQLPSLWQWCSIRWLTQKKKWTPPQRQMMAKAGKYHAVRGVVLALFLAVGTITGLLIRDHVDDERKATHAAGLVQSLLEADTAGVPNLIDQLKDYRLWADPLLEKAFDKQPKDSPKKLHASVALLRKDKSYLDYVVGRMLEASPQEIWFLHQELLPHQQELQRRLWEMVASQKKRHGDHHLSAICILACLPSGKDANWPAISETVVESVLASVQKNPSNYPVFLKTFQQVSDHLLAPLSTVFRNKDRSDSERLLAASLLADYAADQPPILAGLLLDGDEKQFAVIFVKFRDQGEQGLRLLTGEIDKKLPSDLASSDEKREKLAKRQANAAVALLKMKQPEKVWPLLKRSPPDDPRVRSYLIHKFGPLGADPKTIVKRLDEEADVTIRRALILSLGEYGEKDFPVEDRKRLLPKLQEIYRNDADPGLHAAAEWLLRIWKQKVRLKQVNDEWAKDGKGRERKIDGIKDLVTKEKEKTPPQWYVNSQGQTMVVIPGPVEFMMGSPPSEDGHSPIESQHKRRIGRTFAVAAKSVTVQEFRRFLKETKLEAWFEAGGQAAPLMKKNSPDEHGPILLVDWYKAAAYCNWLSEQEGIDKDHWCYETDAQGQVKALKAKYLSLTGYRLPTEAEMEYATRAGALTSRYYGETEELLPKYAWYQKNSKDRTWPVGSLKPNDLGLFDVQGNVYSWCQESYREYPAGKTEKAAEDQEDVLVVNSTGSRVLRGGSFLSQASNVRSALRNYNVPSTRNANLGFRPARTLPLDCFTALPPPPKGAKIETESDHLYTIR